MIGNTHQIQLQIADGESLTAARDLEGYLVFAFVVPAGWTAASLTVLAGTSINGPFYPVHDENGDQIEILVEGEQVVVLEKAAGALSPLRWVRFQSVAVGDPTTAVNQGDDRTITVLMKA